MQLVNIHKLDFNKSFTLKKFFNPNYTSSEEMQKLRFRVSFYDFALDKISAPIIFSEQKEVLMSQGMD